MNQTTTSLLRVDRVVERRGRSRAQLYVDVKRGTMPPPLHLGDGSKISAWPSTEVDQIIRAEVGGASQDELRELVKQLLEQRQRMKPVINRDGESAAA